MKVRPFDVCWLGRIPFDHAVELQERTRAEILAGRGRETLFLCEHEPVITLGRSARPEHVLVSETELERRGVAVARASRGGGATYHGPGQLVGYPVFRLRRGIVDHVERMAAALIDVLFAQGVNAFFRRAAPGLWTVDAPPGSRSTQDAEFAEPGAKVCAFGVHVRRRVAIHGFALNLCTPLDPFSFIVPCGLPGARVTSVAALTGTHREPSALVDEVERAFMHAFVPDGAPAVQGSVEVGSRAQNRQHGCAKELPAPPQDRYHGLQREERGP